MNVAGIAVPGVVPMLTFAKLEGTMPVPLKLICAVPLVEELLLMVSCPVAVPATAGSNSIPSVAVWSGFNVVGKVAPAS